MNGALAAAHALFERGDADELDAWLHDDVELRPPTYGKSWVGRILVGRLLRFAAESLRPFRYTDVLSMGDVHVLRFEARVGELAISGVDVLRLDGHGRIALVEIFARPPKAVLALRDAMGAHVRTDAAVASLMGMA